MRMRARLALAAVTAIAACCAVVAGWGAHDLVTARQCLDGELYPHMSGASITERGCEVVTPNGGTTLVPLNGPPFEWFLATSAATVLTACGLTVLALAHLARLGGRR